MASPQTKGPARVFIDSSVLYAAALSPTGPARRLILKGFEEEITLFISDLVLEETERNLQLKAPQALPLFSIFCSLLYPNLTHATKAAVLRAARIVHSKDAPIVAAAARVKAEYLATHDLRHLLSHREEIENSYGIKVLTPGELLSLAPN